MNEFALSIISKLLVGLILAAVLIISFFNLSQYLYEYLGEIENGYLYQVCIYWIFLIGSAAGLFFLLTNRGARTRHASAETSMADLLSYSIMILGAKFIEGFICEAVKESDKNKKPKEGI